MRFAAYFVCALAIFGIASPIFGQKPESLKHAREGFNYEQKAQYKYAIFEYDTAIKLDPKYPYPVERIGGLYQVLKNYPLAISYYQRALRIDSNYDVYIYYNLGLCYRIVQKYDTAVLALREFLRRMDPVNRTDTLAMKDADWWIKFDLGCIVELAKPKNTDDPIAMADVNSKYDDFAPTMTADGNTLYFTSRRPRPGAKSEIETGDYGDALFESHRDSLLHWSKPLPLPPPLDYTDDEGAASVSADGQTLYLSLCRRSDGVGECDLYQSQLAGDIWSKPQNMGRVINSPAWDGQPTVTADGITMYFSSRRFGSMGDSSEDIYVSYKNVEGSWTPPRNLGEPINTRFNERSPFISADGNTLYFSSNGHPGFGNHDLFMSRKLDDGTWSVPINLGRPINAYGDDVFLTIPAIGDKIIYATQRDNARGPLNLYDAKLPLEFRPGPVTLVSGTVYDKVTRKPVGAKVDVNDLKANQRVATYHANKVTGKYFVTLGTGKMYGITATADGYAPFSDSYTVPDTIPYREIAHDLPLTPLPNYAGNIESGNNGPDTNGDWLKHHKPTNNGHVPDTNGDWLKHHKPANNGHIPDTNGDWLKHHKPANNGHIPDTNGDWLKHKKPSNNGHVPDTNGDWLKHHKPKHPITNEPDISGMAGIPLNNIFFDFDEATLKPESRTELGYLIEMLKKNPKFRIEIDGFTDSIGTAAYNLRLSQGRAEAVRKYLITNGIAANRLKAKGFGDSRPLAVNENVIGRRQNRRTEFRFIR